MYQKAQINVYIFDAPTDIASYSKLRSYIASWSTCKYMGEASCRPQAYYAQCFPVMLLTMLKTLTHFAQ